MQKDKKRISLLWDYGTAICDWWGIMSGAASIPLAAIALFLPVQPTPRYVFATLAILASWGCIISMVNRIRELQQRIAPRLILKCDGEDGTFCPTILGGEAAVFYRTRIETLGESSVENCSAHVLNVHKNGVRIPIVEVLQLGFPPHGDAEKTIRPGVPDFIDIIFSVEGKHPVIRTSKFIFPFSVPVTTMFQDHATYLVEVVATGKSGIATKGVFEFVWKGDKNTARIRLLPNGGVKPPSPVPHTEAPPPSTT